MHTNRETQLRLSSFANDEALSGIDATRAPMSSPNGMKPIMRVLRLLLQPDGATCQQKLLL